MSLNLYWYYKILKKLARIIKGTDGYNPEDEEENDDNYKEADDQEKAAKKKKLKLERV